MVTKMKQGTCLPKRKILLVIVNCTAHPRGLELTNINIKFLPPNTTAKLQPCDQGIIQSLKVHYRHQLVKIVIIDGNWTQKKIFGARCIAIAKGCLRQSDSRNIVILEA